MGLAVTILAACQPSKSSDTAAIPQTPSNSVTDLQTAAAEALTRQEQESYLTSNPGEGYLTPERINSSPSLSGSTLRAARIAPSGEFVTVLQGREDNASLQDLWAYDLESGKGRLLVSATDILGEPEILSEEEKNRRERAREYGSGIISYSWASDTLLLFPLGGDIYLYDIDTKKSRQITATNAFETDAKVSDDGSKVTYVRSNELYIKDIETGLERQLTTGTTDTIRNATASFVVQEEFGRSTGYWMNSDASRIAYTQIDESNIAIENRIDFGADGVTNIAQRYPFAGTDNASVKLGIVRAKGGKTRWVKLGENDDIYLTRVAWAPDNRYLFAGILSRDHKTHTFYKIDSQTGKAETFYRETSPTWLNIGYTLRATEDGGLIWAAERNDKRQLFKISSGGDITALTPDNLMLRSLLCQTGDTAYVSGWQDNPLSTHIFKVNIAAPNPEEGASLNAPLIEQLTSREGQNGASFNGDCSRFLGSYNSVSIPPQLRAYQTQPDASTDTSETASTAADKTDADGTVSPVTASPATTPQTAPKALAWLNQNTLDDSHPSAPFRAERIIPEFGQLDTSDGTKLDYALFKPKDLKPNEKRASVTLVYNGPGVQRVANKWRGNNFPNMLAHHGFVVFMVDGRGASNRGKAFEDVLYRAMGKAEVIDQSAGAAWLKSQSFIDPDRMGIYGWSYGGYMSLHMLAQTNHYAAGVAGAPVTDWALYDTAYTERYLGSPVVESENYTAGSYENASVFPHLKGLTEPVLLIHGMADDNVVFRHSVKLMDAMQKNGSQNLRVMTYPGEKHGFRSAENRIHKDRQILEFFLEKLDIQDTE